LWGQRAAPFHVSSVFFPLVGSTYLDDQPGWIPVATSVQQLKGLGANDVRITVSAGYYDSPTASVLSTSSVAGTFTPSDDKVVAFIQQLKAAGLGVTLQPFIHVAIDPANPLAVQPTPTDFNTWLAGHTSMMVHWATLAQQAGVDRFIVISDPEQTLTIPQANASGWVDMIRQVRAAYSGTLLVEIGLSGQIFPGGLTGIDLRQKAILDAVDVIGVAWNAAPLTNTVDPTLSQLVGAWRMSAGGVDSVAFLQGISTKYQKPVEIADITFHSFAGDNINPNNVYDSTAALTADQQEQANELDSFLSVMSQNQGLWLGGVSIDSWNRFPPNYAVARYLDSPVGENIQGKLAENTLRQWYTGQRVTASAGSLSAEVIGREVTLSWLVNSSPSVIGYVVEAGSTAESSDVFTINVDASSSRFAVPLTPGTYHLRLRAVNAAGTSSISNEVVATVHAVSPSAPGALAASVTGNVIHLSWQAGANSMGATYVIEMGSGPGLTDLGTVSSARSETTVAVPNPPGTRFVFRVLASNSAGESGPSNEVQVTLP
jgi:hypothetical protein